MNKDDQESPPKQPWDWRRTAPIAAFAAGGIGMTIGIYALANPQRYVAMADNPVKCSFVISAGLLLVGLGLAVVPGRRSIRQEISLGVIVFIALAVPATTSYLLHRETHRQLTSVAVSEDGQHEIVVERMPNENISPVDIVFLQSRNGLLSRRDKLGCFNVDNGRQFHSATFHGKTRVAIVGSDGPDGEGHQVNKTWTLRFNRSDVAAKDKLPKDSCGTSPWLSRLNRSFS